MTPSTRLHRTPPGVVQLPASSSSSIGSSHDSKAVGTPSVVVRPHTLQGGRTQSSSSIASVHSLNSTSANSGFHGSSHSSSASGKAAEEIEASLRQWRNHVFPSLKAGNYVSPGQETPEIDKIHPTVEPLLPSCFESRATNGSSTVQVNSYRSPTEFLDDCTRDEENAFSWRMEMIFGLAADAIEAANLPANLGMASQAAASEGIWLALWSGDEAKGTRMLEFCLMKTPSRPLILSSPLPLNILPTSFLQDRMQILMDFYLSLPAVSNLSQPFSPVMGSTRLVEVFLLHWDSIEGHSMPPSSSYSNHSGHHFDPSGHSRESSAASLSVTIKDASRPVNSRNASTQTIVPSISANNGRTVKPLFHTRANTIPPAVSLSEGFVVRLAENEDDLRTLTGLFQSYSETVNHYLDDYQAKKALSRAMANSSVWIYYVFSQCFPGLSLVAGFLTTERRRKTLFSPSSKQDSGSERISEVHKDGKNGSVAITAVYTDESYRRRGVAESLVRTTTRFYLAEQGYSYVSVYVDPRNETAARVFSRVGYGIVDREGNEEIPNTAVRECLTRQVAEEARSAPPHQSSHLRVDTSFDQIDGDEDAASTPHPGSSTTATGRQLPAGVTRSGLAHAENGKEGSNGDSDDGTESAEQAAFARASAAPMTEENDASVPAGPEIEAGPLSCRTYEDWQVVSLQTPDLEESHAAAERRNRRKSRDGPWI